MKKLLIILLISSSCTHLFAQSDLGIYLGPNFANVNMKSPELSADTRSGFQGGVFFRKGDLVYGQLGLEYQLMKVHFNDAATIDGIGNDDIRFQQFNAPLYIGLNLIPVVDNLVNVRIYAGPTFSYLFDVPVNELEFTVSDFSKVTVDASVGAGLEILMFNLDVGYNFGVSELFQDEFSGRANYAFVNAGISF